MPLYFFRSEQLSKWSIKFSNAVGAVSGRLGINLICFELTCSVWNSTKLIVRLKLGHF